MLFLISSTGLQNNRRTKQTSNIFTYIYLDKANTTTALSGVIILSLSLCFSLSRFLSQQSVCLSPSAAQISPRRRLWIVQRLLDLLNGTFIFAKVCLQQPTLQYCGNVCLYFTCNVMLQFLFTNSLTLLLFAFLEIKFNDERKQVFNVLKKKKRQKRKEKKRNETKTNK